MNNTENLGVLKQCRDAMSELMSPAHKLFLVSDFKKMAQDLGTKWAEECVGLQEVGRAADTVLDQVQELLEMHHKKSNKKSEKAAGGAKRARTT